MGFCGHCGSAAAPATWSCAACGGENAAGTGFCGHCGAPVATGAATPEAAAPTTDKVADALRSFVAGPVAERLMEAGERFRRSGG